MPHVDELLGPAALAAAGLFAVIALQPAAPVAKPAPTQAAVPADGTHAARIVRLPSIEVVGRRDASIARADAKRKASG